ncbi:hypothetical protein HMPREF0880_04263 [Yokenella regensburgei ATCC 43003]|nr:hypothetical protein HMPREF0880_04263 [Yokenella regensburgei ATCC 43003]
MKKSLYIYVVNIIQMYYLIFSNFSVRSGKNQNIAMTVTSINPHQYSGNKYNQRTAKPIKIKGSKIL